MAITRIYSTRCSRGRDHRDPARLLAEIRRIDQTIRARCSRAVDVCSADRRDRDASGSKTRSFLKSANLITVAIALGWARGISNSRLRLHARRIGTATFGASSSITCCA